MSNFFSFGEKIPEYEMKVLNEREVRASAGILFLFAMISFLNSWLIGDFTITKTFVVVFLVDFSIRILINPKYSPTLIIGRFFVRNQEVEYVGAPQKRFAWLIGLVLAIVMFYLIVLNNLIGPFNLLVCLICLTLLFFEAAFGICLGCKIYNLFHKQKAELCPGNSCALKDQVAIQKMNALQYVLPPLFIALVFFVANSSLIQTKKHNNTKTNTVAEDCTAPDWAIKMGHEEKWKLHNGCANPETTEQKTAPPNKIATPVPVKEAIVQPEPIASKDCDVPEWAIKMGHREQWKLHNGCADIPSPTLEHEAPAPNIVAPAPIVKEPVAEPKPAANKDCEVPEWAIKMGHREKWKLHNGCE